MSTERRIVAASLQSREAFEKIKSVVDRDQMAHYATYMLDLIEGYYKRDGTKDSVDKDYVLEKTKLDFDNPKKAVVYQEFATECFGVDLSALNLADVISEQKEKESREVLAQILVNNTGTRTELLEKIDRHRALLLGNSSGEDASDSEIFNNVPVHEINRVLNPEGRIRLISKNITRALNGGAIPGMVIYVFARPEVGKSAFALSAAASFVRQGLEGVYIENEDPTKITVERFQACLSEMAVLDRLRDPDAAQKVLDARNYKLATFVGMAPGSVDEINDYCEKHKPKWMVINQSRNVKSRAENRTNQLESVAIGTRGVAKAHSLILVNVTQAGDSGTNKLCLEMGDVDGSNCLAKGTEILMHDGSRKCVENIRTGEKVMGTDSLPRTVLATGQGRQPLYKITHRNGDTYTVNESHIMTVYNSDTIKLGGIDKKQVGDLPLKKLLAKPYLLKSLKGIWSDKLEYPSQELPIDPYLLGLWLADGFSHTFSISTSDAQLRDHLLKTFSGAGPRVRIVNTNSYVISFGAQDNGHPNPNNVILRGLGIFRNKRIPNIYAINDSSSRLKLLAGLIDGDGSMRRCTKAASDCYNISCGTNEVLAEDILSLVKGLGYQSSKHKGHETNWCVSVSGRVTEIPTILDRKKASRDSRIKWLASNLIIEKVSESGEYFGISVDKDERYVLGNYIVTHNTGIPGACDVMIGIGCTPDFERDRMRMINFPKNKTGGGHVHFPMRINESISKYEDI